MSCNCGNSSGFSSSCNSCNTVADIDIKTPLETIQNGDDNFCMNGISDELCENLQKDKGIHPRTVKNEDDEDVEQANNDCTDLHALNQYYNGDLWNKLKSLDFCNMKELRCWLFELINHYFNLTKGLVCAICGLWSKVHELEANQFQLVSCQETGSGIFEGTSFSGSYMIDGKAKTRALTTYQLRIQIKSPTKLVIPAGTQIPIQFVGKTVNDTKLPCLDNIVENFTQIVWHNYDIKSENEVPYTWTAPCYIGTPGRGGGRNFNGNVYIIAKEQDVVFEANVPYQTAMTWAFEPIVVN